MTSTPANERSRASTISNSQPQAPANLNKEDADDWLAIERALTHIQSVNPSHPYVLTIPHDVEPRYHHQNQHPVQKTLWLENTPFSEKEHEASQYLTWHLHDPGDIYVQHSTRPREERGDASSRVGTPKAGSGGVKKTMSLGAYKKKVAGGTPAPEEKKAEVNGVKKEGVEEKKTEEGSVVKSSAVKGPVERVKADEEVLAAVDDEDKTVPPPAEKKEKQEENKTGLKRKREEQQEVEKEEVKRRREDSKMSEDREKPEDRKKKTETTGERKTDAQNQEKPVKPTETSGGPAPKKARQAPPSETQDEQEKQPPTKKAKVSPSTDAPADLKSETKAVAEDNPRPKPPKSPDKETSSPPLNSKESDNMALPPRLSPLREDSKKDDGEDNSLLLPPRLSPTLPANIMATLEARKQQRSTSKSSAQGDNLTPPRKTLENGIARRKSPVNGFRANSSSPMVRSDAEETRGRSSKTSAARARSRSRSGDESEIPVGRSAGPVKKEDKSRLIVKLKFKQRSTRDNLKQLLKLPAAKKKPEPKPSPTAPKTSDARHREQRDVNAKGVAQRVGPATKGVAKKVEKAATSTLTPSEKRARDEESESDSRPAKRKKADQAVYEPPGKRKKPPSESLNLKQSTPATPSQKTQQPPTPASSVAKPSSQPTPSTTAGKKSGKELLAAATTSASMKREASHDSQAQVLTPSAASSSPAASSNSQSQAPKSTPANTSTPAPSQPKTQRQKDWEAQRKIYDQLGRELKHAASADLTTASESKSADPTSTLHRLAAIKILESLLAYFLAFISDDESLAAADPPIPARTTYWRSLKDYFPFVRRNTDAFPELQGLACGLAVVFCARIVEGCMEERVPAGGELMGQAWGLLSRSAGMAEAKLGVERLRARFPKAWAEGVEGVGGEVVEGKERLEPGKFGGNFRLPIGVQTKPVVAVRAAQGILREWIEREGVGYEMRVKLE